MLANPDYFFDASNPDFRSVDLDALDTYADQLREARLEEGGYTAGLLSGHGWRLGAGMRYTRYRIQSASSALGPLTTSARGSDITGQVGVERDLMDSLALRMTGASGLRPAEGRQADGDYLPPRRSRLLEGGIRWRPVNGAVVDLSRYRLEERNRPKPDKSTPDDGDYKPEGLVVARGLEFSARWRAQACGVSLVAARTDARYRSEGEDYRGNRLVGVPTGSAGLTGDCRINAPGPLPDRLEWRTRWQGDRWVDEANNLRIGAHTVHGFRALWDMTATQRLELDVVNLTDRDHLRSVTAPDDMYQGPTRRFRLTWRWTPR